MPYRGRHEGERHARYAKGRDKQEQGTWREALLRAYAQSHQHRQAKFTILGEPF